MRTQPEGGPTDATLVFHWHPGRVGGGGSVVAPSEQRCAFLDDVYLLCDPSRVRFLYDMLASALARGAGIQLHQEKTRAWNRAGVIPDNIAEFGPRVWQPEGITVLGTPFGTELYVSQKIDEGLAKERELWEAIPTVPDLQCAWQLLLKSREPSGEPHHAYRASKRFFCMLSRTRRGHVGHCQNLVGWSSRNERGRQPAVVDTSDADGRSFAVTSEVRTFRVLDVMGRCLAYDQPAHTRRGP